MNLFDKIPGLPTIPQYAQEKFRATSSQMQPQPMQQAQPSIFDTYMQDTSISANGKKAMQEDLQNGVITQEQANKVISDIYAKRKTQEKTKPEREGFVQNVGGFFQDIVGGAVEQVPRALGNIAEFGSKAGQYTPFALGGTAIQAGLSDKTFGQIREEQKADAEKLGKIGEAGSQFVQKYGAYDPNSVGATIGRTGIEIGASLAGPNKVGAIQKLGKLATPTKIAMEGGLAGAKYDVASKGEITPTSVGVGALGNLGVQGAFQGGKALFKSATTPKVLVPKSLGKSQADALKIITPDSYTASQLEELKLAGKVDTGKGITGEKVTYKPDKFDIEVAKNASPYLKKGASTSENISFLGKAIENEGTALENAIKAQNPIIPKRQVASHVKDMLTKVMDDPEMVGDNAKIAQNLLNKYKAMVNEEGGTALGILKARKRFDAYIKSVKPKAFDAPTGRAYDTAVKTIRDGANDLLDSLVLTKSARQSLRKQFLLYKAREALASKKDISTVGKILKSPITKIAGGAALGGAGVGVISNF